MQITLKVVQKREVVNMQRRSNNMRTASGGKNVTQDVNKMQQRGGKSAVTVAEIAKTIVEGDSLQNQGMKK